MYLKLRTLVYIGIAFLVLSIGVYKINGLVGDYNDYRSDLEESFNGPSERIAKVDLDDLPDLIVKLNSDFEDGALKIKDMHYKDSAEWFRRAEEEIKPFLEQHPKEMVQEGLNLEDWFASKEDIYRASLDDEWRVLMTNVRDGSIGRNTIREFTQSFERIGFDDYTKEFNQNRSTIAAIRAQKAKHWFRIKVTDKTHGSRAFLREKDRDNLKILIEEAFENKWEDVGPFKIVFGEPLDGTEGYATWKTMNVEIHQDVAKYTVGYNSTSSGNMPQIPHHMRLVFNVKETKKNQLTPIPTSWDKIPTMIATSKPPESIYFETERGTRVENLSFDQIEENHRVRAHEELLTKIEEALPKMPEFELYPGQEPSGIEIVDHGEINFHNASMLAYMSPLVLTEKIKGAIQNDDGELSAQIMKAAILLKQEEFTGYVSAMLPRLNNREQGQIFKALKENPSYGNLPEMAKEYFEHESNPRPDRMLDLLKGKFSEPAIARLVLEKANDKSYEYRNALVYHIFSEASEDEIRDLAKIWLLEEDSRFTIGVASALLSSNRKIALELMMDMNDEIHASTLNTLVSSYSWKDPQGKKEADFFKKIFLESQDKHLTKSAYRALFTMAKSPAGWDTLNEIKDSIKDEKKLWDIREKLCVSVKDAYPKKAEEHLLNETKSGDAKIYNQSVWGFLTVAKDKDKALGALAELHRKNPADQKLLEVTLREIAKYAGRNLEWKMGPQAESMNYFLGLASSISSFNDRQSLYSAMGASIVKGHLNYKALLEQASKGETDPRAQKTIAKYIAKANSMEVASAN